MLGSPVLGSPVLGSSVIGSPAAPRADAAATPKPVATTHAGASADPLVIGPADHILYIYHPRATPSPAAALPPEPAIAKPRSAASMTPVLPTATPTPTPPASAAAIKTPTPGSANHPVAGKSAKSNEPPLGLADHILYIPARAPVLKNAGAATVGGVISHNSASSTAKSKFGPPEPPPPWAGKGPTPGEAALSNTTNGSQFDAVNWSVMIYKSRHLLTVYYKSHFYQSYRAVFGRNLDHSAKVYAGDRRTPEGVYSIIRKYRSPRFRWFLKLNYPNDVDWARFQDMQARHLIAVSAVRSPGNAIGIHGTDEPLLNEADINWTTGCISVDNWAISELATVLPVGTLVVIKP